MILPCSSVCSGHCPNHLLVKREMTQDDNDYWDEVGWDDFREEFQLELPEVAPPLYFFYEPKDGFVVEMRGKRWKVKFREEFGWNEPWEPGGKSVEFIRTNEPLSVPDRKGPTRAEWLRGYRRGSYHIKFFGQPTWVQGEHHALDSRGNPFCNLMTIENGWGDSGNYNILIGFDENDDPAELYFEASCC